MKALIWLALSSTLSQTAFAGSSIKPEISIGLNADSFKRDVNLASSLLGTLEPTIKWFTSGKLPKGDIDYEGGVTVRGEENGNLPYNVWGKLKKSIGGWDLSTRLDTSSSKLEKVTYDVQVTGGPTNVKLQMKGSANIDEPISAKISSVKAIQSLKGVGVKDGTVTVIPSYNLDSKQTDVTVSYGLQDTVLIVDANLDAQKYTIRQRFGDNNSISPSITNDGDIEVEYCRAVGDTGIASVRVKPNSFIGAKYEDSVWTADIVAPIIQSKDDKGFGKLDTDAIKFSLRRSVS